ncbi:unnamed protein product [Chilo suppressalis]|uniref:Carboxylic ester hydrolase n=1 Tax=Chilo suppressalis TaxID=168631 RepID=A0ABN8BEI3_CHISP|nr:unnamed protein product [Chilo suppressalis]
MSTSSQTLTKCLIETADGPIYGFQDVREDGTYYKFKKIPYAKPPLGALRFRPPSAVTPWKEVLDCTQDADLPIHSKDGEICGSEDCLYIEISTKSIKRDKPLPVMFWIGTYLFSINIDNYFDPSLLNDHDVIFVRCGFRLGPLGFLSINEFTAPGNSGLKDLVMALKWIQRNIDRFGGDPNNVTIFGSSTGGSAVHLLMMSPMASGLFHKAIIQSSSVLNNWSLTKNPSLAVMELSKKLGVTKLNVLEMVEELRLFSAEDIIKATESLQEKLMGSDQGNIFDCIFKPCIEDDLEGLAAFLPKSPILILKSGNFNKVPLIIGSNNIEGSVLEYLDKDFFSNCKIYEEDVGCLVPRSLSCNPKYSKDIGQKLFNFYLGEDHTCENIKTQYLQLISDYYFLYYVNKTVRLHSEFAPECPVFYYIVNCAGEWSVPKELNFLSNLGHSAEIPFIFRIRTTDSPSNPEICKGSRDSIVTRSRVVKMWTNFAKFGNPTPEEDDPLLEIKWDSVDNKEKLNYLSIGTELTKGRNPFHERMIFWEQLHKDFTFLRMLVYFNDIGVVCVLPSVVEKHDDTSDERVQSAIVEVEQLSQWPVKGWVTKSLLY